MNETAELLPDIVNYCRQYDLLPDSGRIIVGLSGGPDSRVLLDLLIRMAADSQLALVAAHLNHSLRGDASDQDEQSVREACALARIPLFVQRRRIADEAKALGLSMEETGRNARYAFFDTIALHWLQHSLPIDRPILDQETMERMTSIQMDACLTDGIRIAVGHQRNDQAETVLMNLCRGSGLQGMVGMMPRNGLIVRPLLNISRERIEQYAEMRNLSFCTDLSNTETDATRNRIRHFVLPAIQNAFGGDAISAMARAANLLRDDADYLNHLASNEFDRISSTHLAENEKPANAVPESLPVCHLVLLHPAIRSRVLRQWYERFFGDVHNLSAKHIQAMNELCLPNRSGRQCSLPEGRRAVRDFDRIILFGSETSSERAYGSDQTAETVYPLIIPGKTAVPNVGGFFVTQLIENECQIVYNNQIWCFPAAKLTAAVVRCRQPQDHFRPAGRVHGKSLKKYLTERKIPAFIRDRLPLIACGSEIIWIPGVAATDDLPDLPDLPSRLNALPACSNQLIQVRFIEPES